MAQGVEGTARRAVQLESQRRERIENLVQVEELVRVGVGARKRALTVDEVGVELNELIEST